jgi:hypothetical protein
MASRRLPLLAITLLFGMSCYLVGGATSPLGFAAPRQGATPSDAAPTGSESNLAVTSISPERLLDTRVTEPSLIDSSTPLAAGETRRVPAAGLGSIPTDAVGVVVNLTAVGATVETFLTLFPSGSSRPVASTMNPSPGAPAYNSATVLLDGGAFDLYNNAGSVDVIVDVTGYLTADLRDSVEHLQSGEIVSSPPLIGRALATPLYLNWAGVAGGGSSELTAALYGILTSADRYPSARARVQAVVEVLGTQIPDEICIRAASLDTGPVVSSEVCVSTSDPTFVTDFGGSYFFIEGPLFDLPRGIIFPQAKLVVGGASPAQFELDKFNLSIYSG